MRVHTLKSVQSSNDHNNETQDYGWMKNYAEFKIDNPNESHIYADTHKHTHKTSNIEFK